MVWPAGLWLDLLLKELGFDLALAPFCICLVYNLDIPADCATFGLSNLLHLRLVYTLDIPAEWATVGLSASPFPCLQLRDCVSLLGW